MSDIEAIVVIVIVAWIGISNTVIILLVIR